MNSNIEKNVNWMILGQSGVGKSSLINYLYGSEIAKTGVGKPVTEKGTFTTTKVEYPPDNNDNTFYTFYDSWGLESDKAEEWIEVILEKLEIKSIGCDINQTFLGVIFCISYARNGIQDFETDYIKEIINSGYNVIIVFTNKDFGEYEQQKDNYRNKIQKELGLENKYKYRCIDVCTGKEGTKKIGSNVPLKRSGKEEVLNAIKECGYKNFKSLMKKKIDSWKSVSIEGINNLAYYSNDNILSKPEDIDDNCEQEINDKLQKLLKNIISKLQEEIKKSITWYSAFKVNLERMSMLEKIIDTLDIFGFLEIPEKIIEKNKNSLKKITDKLKEEIEKMAKNLHKKIDEIQ